jgi:hypothetical protein
MSATVPRTSALPSALEDPLLNRGVGFTAAQREAPGLTGRLPDTADLASARTASIADSRSPAFMMLG